MRILAVYRPFTISVIYFIRFSDIASLEEKELALVHIHSLPHLFVFHHSCIYFRFYNFGPFQSLGDCAEAYRQMADIKYQMEDSVKQNFLDPLAHLQNNELKDVMVRLICLELTSVELKFFYINFCI